MMVLMYWLSEIYRKQLIKYTATKYISDISLNLWMILPRTEVSNNDKFQGSFFKLVAKMMKKKISLDIKSSRNWGFKVMVCLYHGC